MVELGIHLECQRFLVTCRRLASGCSVPGQNLQMPFAWAFTINPGSSKGFGQVPQGGWLWGGENGWDMKALYGSVPILTRCSCSLKLAGVLRILPYSLLIVAISHVLNCPLDFMCSGMASFGTECHSGV